MREPVAKRRTVWLDLEPASSARVRRASSQVTTFHASLEAIAETQIVEAAAVESSVPAKRLRQKPQQPSRRPTLAEQIALGLRNHVQARGQKRSETHEDEGTAVLTHGIRVTKPAPAPAKTLASMWSWLRTKCESSATKRLRVTEVASLGEKRFVAIVNVGSREFLVGGGTSGVTLLTPLETAQGKTDWARAELSVAGDIQ